MAGWDATKDRATSLARSAIAEQYGHKNLFHLYTVGFHFDTCAPTWEVQLVRRNNGIPGISYRVRIARDSGQTISITRVG